MKGFISIKKGGSPMRFLKFALIAGSMLAAVAASAQTPAPPAPPAAGGLPDKVPGDIPYGQSIGAEKAKQVLAAAEAEGKKRGWPLCIAVADTNGDLVAFLRMEGAQVGSVVVSQGKARTAVRYRRETRIFYNAYETGHPYVSTLDPTLVASPGGYPLVENGKLIGAIGCSGGTGDQDAAVCKVGADVVK
jgi:glc operon protein GlcG